MTQANKNLTSPSELLGQPNALDSLLKPELFKALADPTRLSLLSCLTRCGRPCDLGEVASCCSVDLSVVSRHMNQLEAAGIVHSKKVGRRVFFSTCCQELSTIFRGLADCFDNCAAEAKSSESNSLQSKATGCC